MKKNDALFFFSFGLLLAITSVVVIMYDINLPTSGIVNFLISGVIGIIEETSYLGIFILMVLESALIPIPSEIIMPFSGFLCYLGSLSLFWVVMAGTLGNLVGSLIAYWIGLKFGRAFIIKYGKYLLLHESHLDFAEKLFNRYGEIIVFISRLLPAVRTVISLPAGIGKMNLKRFVMYTFLGSIPWNFALAYLGYLLGEKWYLLFIIFEKLDLIILVGTVIFIIWFVKSGKEVKNL